MRARRRNAPRRCRGTFGLSSTPRMPLRPRSLTNSTWSAKERPGFRRPPPRGSLSESYYNRRIVKVAAIINLISAGADVHAANRRTAMRARASSNAGTCAVRSTSRPAPATHISSRAALPATGPISCHRLGRRRTVNEAGASARHEHRAGLVPAVSGNGRRRCVCRYRYSARRFRRARERRGPSMPGRPQRAAVQYRASAWTLEWRALQRRASRLAGLRPHVMIAARSVV